MLKVRHVMLLQVLIAGHGQNLQPGTVQAALQEVAPLVSDADLLIASLSLSFCTVLLQQQRQQSSLVTDKVLPAAMSLAKSPLLQVGLTHTCTVQPCAVQLLACCLCAVPACHQGLTYLAVVWPAKLENMWLTAGKSWNGAWPLPVSKLLRLLNIIAILQTCIRWWNGLCDQRQQTPTGALTGHARQC